MKGVSRYVKNPDIVYTKIREITDMGKHPIPVSVLKYELPWATKDVIYKALTKLEKEGKVFLFRLRGRVFVGVKL